MTPKRSRFMSKNPSPRIHGFKAIAFALLLSASLVSMAAATTLLFSSGNPDGLVGTLSVTAAGTQIQTETADDFVLTENTIIQQATFTGLIPTGLPLSSITRVEIEFYHVFPLDSTNPPSGMVPTRDNSPADVEIDEATSDSADDTLTFSTSLVNGSFTVANSVVNGINKIPNQTTLGEGPVTGQEVTITVTFNPAITLPAGHYFFRPEVEVINGNFLWVSSPHPVVAPGTPFAPDLQTWIRNDNLAPDWLRVGTDIIGGTTVFNASFTLSGELDADNDGVPDNVDQCADTPANSVVNAQGCSIDQLVPCAGPMTGGTWRNHGEYISTFTMVVKQVIADHLIPRQQKGQLTSAAARSNCGKPSQSGGHHGHGHGH